MRVLWIGWSSLGLRLCWPSKIRINRSHYFNRRQFMWYSQNYWMDSLCYFRGILIWIHGRACCCCCCMPFRKRLNKGPSIFSIYRRRQFNLWGSPSCWIDNLCCFGEFLNWMQSRICYLSCCMPRKLPVTMNQFERQKNIDKTVTKLKFISIA